MTVYDFSLASMYELTGVDTALCNRAFLFREKGCKVKMIFVDVPTVRDLQLYTALGLDYEEILSVYQYYAGVRNLEPVMDSKEMAHNLTELLGCTDEQRQGDFLILRRGERKAAVLHLTADGTSFYTVDYYQDEKLVRTDYYADARYASVFYETDGGRISERYFYRSDGSLALTQVFRNGQEYNVFPDGGGYSKEQLFSLFVRELNLTKDDLVILDRPRGLFPAKELFACFDRTNIIAVIHSEHALQSGFSTQGIGLHMEYWYWCKYSSYIHMMIVGSEEQKKELVRTLMQHHFAVPEIRAIPPLCLDLIRRPKGTRKRKSILCVSRLNERKKIEWTILTTVKAHQLDPEITLDIYGSGPNHDYTDYLERLIAKENALGYISLKGYVDVTEIYQNYEVFLTTSLWETFGITLLEAAGSGLPIVGLDVRYGNRLFIEDGRNGYRIPYNPEHIFEECPSEIEALAEKVVELLSDEGRWNAFSARSYEIAEQYLAEHVKQKWYDLLPSQAVGQKGTTG